MTAARDEKIDAYLWDPAETPAVEVTALEAGLVTLRFAPDATPLILPEAVAPRQRQFGWRTYLAAAAVVLLIGGASFVQWRLRWPSGQAWTVEADASEATRQLSVGTPLQLPKAEEARIRIARIGTLQLTGDARLTLEQTGGSRHRLGLERGTMHVRVWAPPSSVRIDTPSGDVIDLGCEFDLTVDGEGTSAVAVRSGWVLMANRVGESLIPAGAASEMRVDREPGAPVFTDASPEFVATVRALETGRGVPDLHVATIVGSARARDLLTLLVLIERRAPGRERIAARAAELMPPPSGVSIDAILRGDSGGLQRWRDTLPLPAPKSWLRNWRDALPVWLVGTPR
jgi:hypothetical protein